MAANDGQTLSGQSEQTKQDFQAVYGGNASQAWEQQHNAAIASQQPQQQQGPTPAPSPGAPQPGAPPSPVPANPAGALGGQIDKLLQAIASGNKQAFDETVREFNQTFALSQAGLTGTYNGQQTLAAQAQQFGQGVTAAGLTGTYNGQQTLAALKQQADIAAQRAATAQADASLTGTYQGQQTLAALKQQADIAAQKAATAQQWASQYGYVPQFDAMGNPIAAGGAGPATTLGAQQQAYAQQMGAVNAAAALQANPFRQAQVIGQAGRILQGMPSAGFQAPNIVSGVGTAGGNTQGGMGYLSQLIADIKDPTANQTTADAFLGQTPTPNKIDSASFLRSTPGTQNLILQAMQERYGIQPDDALTQIKNTLPAFNAPNTTGVIRRG